jgi:tRNA-dihydrouridine synthase
VDWQAVKTEYITTDTSYRKLAQKYGIDQATIARRAKKEGWVGERQRHISETQAKIIKSIGSQQASRAARLQMVADKLLGRVEGLLESPDDHALDTQAMKHISGVLKDIKEIQMIRSDADMREQEARIANLERQAQKDDDDRKQITVVLEGAMKDYAQ